MLNVANQNPELPGLESLAVPVVGGPSGVSDPFDPTKLRLSQNFGERAGVKKVLTRVPCRKPHRQEFVRVRPGEDWRLPTLLFEDAADRETYLVQPDFWREVEAHTYPATLCLAVNNHADPFLWPLKLPGSDGRSNSWNESAVEAAKLAEVGWVQVASNMRAGQYTVVAPVSDLGEPEWPELSFRELLKLCFRDRFIDRPEHPVLKRLRGEV